jgi:hypothetical protein
MGDAAVIVSEFLRDAPAGEFMEVVTGACSFLCLESLWTATRCFLGSDTWNRFSLFVKTSVLSLEMTIC